MNAEKPFSKCIMIALGIVVASLGTGTIISYLRTAQTEIARTVAEQTPITFDLERLKVSASDLLPQITRHRQSIERLRVSIGSNASQIHDLENRQEVARQEMETLHQDLATGKTTFQYGGRSFSRAEVSSDLSSRLDAFERIESEIAEKRKQVQALTSLLTKATSSVDSLAVRRERLIGCYGTLKARLLLADVESASLPTDELTQGIATAEALAVQIEAKIRGFQSAKSPTLAGSIPVEIPGATPEARYSKLFPANP